MSDVHPDIQAVLSGERRWCVVTGDCLDVLRGMPEKCVDAVVTDPPYSVSVPGSVHRGRPGRGSRRLDFFDGDTDWARMTATVAAAVAECVRVSVENGSMYWWCGHRQIGSIVETCEGGGFKTKPLAWVKKCPAPAPPNSGWGSAFEMCVYASRPGRVWHKPVEDNRVPNVIVADSFRHGQPGKVDHPTQKPLAVIGPCVSSCTDADSIILDPFTGSGTTGVAAIKTGRRFIGIEIDEHYANTARERIARAEADYCAQTHLMGVGK